MARGLGQRIRLTRAAAFAVVAVLAGAATAACGPIVFVGLVVPHVARFICGPDYRWILPYSMLLAPIVLLLADVLGRVLAAPGELQVGVDPRRARRADVRRDRALRAGCRRCEPMTATMTSYDHGTVRRAAGDPAAPVAGGRSW